MPVVFEPMSKEHGPAVMDIFNYYVENSLAAYPESKLPYEFFGRFLEMAKGYPAYVIKDTDSGEAVGFCMLRAFNPFPVFRETAELSYFIDKDHVGKQIGGMALERLESDARRQGIRVLLASIASENTHSIGFHRKHGFTECGRFERVGKKQGIVFDVVWMSKELR